MHERHWAIAPENHIVIDLDLVDEDGEILPAYTELSKSGKGVHLHYIVDYAR